MSTEEVAASDPPMLTTLTVLDAAAGRVWASFSRWAGGGGESPSLAVVLTHTPLYFITNIRSLKKAVEGQSCKEGNRSRLCAPFFQRCLSSARWCAPFCFHSCAGACVMSSYGMWRALRHHCSHTGSCCTYSGIS